LEISVILCTFNRAPILRRALASLAKSRVVWTSDWELLIVDNNSTDHTRQVAEDFALQFAGGCRYIFEGRPGKSHALNSALRHARGQILAFVDDDVVVDEHWLQNLTAPLAAAHWAGAGGQISPERDFVPPPWLSLDGRYALAPLAIFSPATRAGELREPPFGTNMAYRAEVFEKVGGFRTDLGPQPGSEIRGEDTEFGMRVLSAGYHIWYEPSAIVYHSLSAHRLRKDYFLSWWYDKARSDVRAGELANVSSLRVAGVPLSLLRRLGMWTLRWVTSIRPAERFSSKIRVWSLAGTIVEFRRLGRSS